MTTRKDVVEQLIWRETNDISNDRASKLRKNYMKRVIALLQREDYSINQQNIKALF